MDCSWQLRVTQYEQPSGTYICPHAYVVLVVCRHLDSAARCTRYSVVDNDYVDLFTDADDDPLLACTHGGAPHAREIRDRDSPTLGEISRGSFTNSVWGGVT